MAGPYPGKKHEAEATRSLTELTDAGVTFFIDLTHPKGASTDSLEPYEHLLARLPNGRKAGYARRPIDDLGVPDAESMARLQAQISGLIAHGEIPYVHCWGGVGRTGTVVGCRLVEQGMTGDEAIDHIAALRVGLENADKPSPENPLQCSFVRDWERPGASSETVQTCEAEAGRLENVVRLNRMAARHLNDCLEEYSTATPIPENALGDALDPLLLPESFDNDVARILEHRTIQRVAIGFWHQADGEGFYRLRAAIEAAEDAADLEFDEADLVLPDDDGVGPNLRLDPSRTKALNHDPLEHLIEYPVYVRSIEEKGRWDAAAKTATAMVSGENPLIEGNAETVWLATRALYKSDIPTETLETDLPEPR